MVTYAYKYQQLFIPFAKAVRVRDVYQAVKSAEGIIRQPCVQICNFKDAESPPLSDRGVSELEARAVSRGRFTIY